MPDDFSAEIDRVIDMSYGISTPDISPANAARLAGTKRHIDRLLDLSKGKQMTRNVSADELARRVRAAADDAGKAIRQTPEQRLAGREAMHARQADLGAKVDALKNVPRVEVVSEGRIYRPDGRHSFIRDLISVKSGSPHAQDARARLERNKAEYNDTTAPRARLIAGSPSPVFGKPSFFLVAADLWTGAGIGVCGSDFQ